MLEGCGKLPAHPVEDQKFRSLRQAHNATQIGYLLGFKRPLAAGLKRACDEKTDRCKVCIGHDLVHTAFGVHLNRFRLPCSTRPDMFDGFFKSRLDPITDRIAAPLAAAGISATAVTLTGFGLGLAAACAVSINAMPLALALFIASRLLDGLDGAVARQKGQTDLGGFLDIVCDFIAYGAFVLAFAFRDPAHALPAAILIFSFYVTGSTFLAQSVFATKRGLSTDYGGRKSLYYAAGLAEGFETILVLSLMALLPHWFPALALGFAALCLVSGVARAIATRHMLRDATNASKGIVLIDSIANARQTHADCVLVSGSHGGPSAAAFLEDIAVRAYVFNDAGRGKDASGVAALSILERRRIAAVAIASDSARIGEARSTFEDGIVSDLNATAASLGVRIGQSARAASEALLQSGQAPGNARGRAQ